MRLVSVDGTTQVEINGARLPLKRHADGTLWCRANPSRGATFEPAADASALDWQELGRHSRLPRLQAPTGAAALAPAGRYRVTDLGLTVDITHGDGPTRLDLQGPHGTMHYTLQARGGGVWAGTHDHALLAAGAVLMQQGGRLTFTTLRTRHLLLDPDPAHG